MTITNYMKYRGKCVEETEKLAKKNPNLKIVKGFYYEPWWDREEEHQWCVDENGKIIDPTSMQYPSGGIAEFYREFDGTLKCSECSKQCEAKSMKHEGRYYFCSGECFGKFVGVC